MYAFSAVVELRSYSRHSGAISCESEIDSAGRRSRSSSRTRSSCAALRYACSRQTATESMRSSSMRATMRSRPDSSSGRRTEPSTSMRSRSVSTSVTGTSGGGLR